ncbi:hypothetical protein CFR76_08560 [Komagataeibacter swingsii]|uniref:Uncharacterized protein n=1 Tax=Komagataeibacter swingsii TaxID=215220 RepID=A0A2V4S3A6_9PROT|nr:hypothetical protein CFR76_08560 [Komagataeibacter swingsii]
MIPDQTIYPANHEEVFGKYFFKKLQENTAFSTKGGIQKLFIYQWFFKLFFYCIQHVARFWFTARP